MSVCRHFFVALAAAGVLLLAGCQSAGSRTGFYSSSLQPGDEVVMLKTLIIPSGMARVYVQDGTITSYAGSNQYAPFCYFLVRDPLPAEQAIRPGTFVVQSVWLDEVAISTEFPLRVASLLLVGGRGPIAYQFHIKLKAADQQDVTLVCSGAFEDPNSAAPIRLNEVRRVLGDYAEVKVKAATPLPQ